VCGGDLKNVPTDEKGRIRLDDLEMKESVQTKVKELWDNVSSNNIFELADIQGYRDAFLQIFGFNIPGVDYESDVDIM
jgi:enoyl-[acyl-carrier protein] reductase/trans-2-enoyl-CoA reductase (NAD+)